MPFKYFRFKIQIMIEIKLLQKELFILWKLLLKIEKL